MDRNQRVSAGGVTATLLIFLNALVIEHGFISDAKWNWLLVFTIPLMIMSLMIVPKNRSDNKQAK